MGIKYWGIILVGIVFLFSPWYVGAGGDFVGPPTAAEQREQKCAESGDCLDQPSFVFRVSEVFDFGSGGTLKSKMDGATGAKKLLVLLEFIIQKLMIGLGIVALFVMTVGAGYMILYHGQDEMLSKGKNIFTAGILALVVALSAYYLVSLVVYIFY